MAYYFTLLYRMQINSAEIILWGSWISKMDWLLVHVLMNSWFHKFRKRYSIQIVVLFCYELWQLNIDCLKWLDLFSSLISINICSLWKNIVKFKIARIKFRDFYLKHLIQSNCQIYPLMKSASCYPSLDDSVLLNVSKLVELDKLKIF
jgi:hypothetical protein